MLGVGAKSIKIFAICIGLWSSFSGAFVWARGELETLQANAETYEALIHNGRNATQVDDRTYFAFRAAQEAERILFTAEGSLEWKPLSEKTIQAKVQAHLAIAESYHFVGHMGSEASRVRTGLAHLRAAELLSARTNLVKPDQWAEFLGKAESLYRSSLALSESVGSPPEAILSYLGQIKKRISGLNQMSAWMQAHSFFQKVAEFVEQKKYNDLNLFLEAASGVVDQALPGEDPFLIPWLKKYISLQFYIMQAYESARSKAGFEEYYLFKPSHSQLAQQIERLQKLIERHFGDSPAEQRTANEMWVRFYEMQGQFAQAADWKAKVRVLIVPKLYCGFSVLPNFLAPL